MSNLRGPQVRTVVRSPGVIAHYPCFQASGDAAMLDRSGAGNNAPIGASATLSTMWTGTANRYGIVADDTSGTTNKAARLAAAAIAFNKDADTLLISGIWNAANTVMRHAFGTGSAADAAMHGFNLRSLVTSGAPQVAIYHSGGTLLGTSGATAIADGADHHVALLIDGPAKRAWLYVNGLDDPTNSGVGLSWAAVAANMTNFGPLILGGFPTNAGRDLVYTSTSYGWHVAKRTGGKPANTDDVIKRLARHPLQVLTAQEWAAA